MSSSVGKLGIAQSIAKVARSVCVALICPALASVHAVAQDESKARITVAPKILATPAGVTPLPLQVGPQGVVPRNSFIRLQGIPPAASLTEGYAIGPGYWAIPLIGLPTLRVIVPVGVSGRSELIITLVAMDGTLLDEARTTFVVEAEVANKPVERTRPEPPLPDPAESYRKSPAAPRVPALSAQERSDAEQLVEQGKRYLDQGNIDVARQYFYRAATAGLAEGAMRLAATYDPAELARLGVQGVVADRAEALRWYERARELGAPDASGLLTRPALGQQ